MLQRYTKARELGTGAVARTYLAVQHGGGGLRRLVAVKDLHQRGGLEPLLDRMRQLAPLEHPHLARIIDQGADHHGHVLVVTDYVVGESVLSLLGRCVRLGQAAPQHLAVRVIADACAGLQAAHTAGSAGGHSIGVVHGALRPSNLLLSYTGCAKVVDCGLSDVDQPRDLLEITPAQAHFMAPELLDSRPVDGRADVYSAGVLLYALLTLRYPYDAHRSVAEVIEGKRRGQLVPPSARGCAVSPELERLLLATLAPDPDQRPKSAASLRHELENLLIRRGRHATHLAVSDYLEHLFGPRIQAKLAALDTVLALPPGQTMPEDTIVDVIDEDQTVDMLDRPARGPQVQTDVRGRPPAFFDEDPATGEAATTQPEFHRPWHKRPRRDADDGDIDVYPDEDTDTDAASLVEDEDTTVR